MIFATQFIKYSGNMSKKRDKFVELAQKRTTRALKSIRVIGNLSNKNIYEYSEADVSKIIKALDGEMKALRERFKTQKRDDDIEFML